MPLPLFAAVSASVTFLNNASFARVVAPSSRQGTWVVLFDSGHNSPFAADFIRTVETVPGVLHFGVVDVALFPHFAQESGVTKIPAIQFYSQNDTFPYAGSFSLKEIVRQSASLVPNFCLPVDLSWRSDAFAHPFLIFFTNKTRVPDVWRLLAAHYRGKSLRFGFTNDSDLLFPFGVRKVPAILAFNGTITAFYKGKAKFTPLANWINAFFAKRLFPGNTTEVSIPRLFKSNCLGGKTPCVLVKQKAVSEKIEALRRQFAKPGLLWFVGIDHLPFDFMKKGEGAWVYNPRKDGFAHAPTVDELELLLEKIGNGQVKWRKVEQMGEL
jgi:hypothetical protein